jgi:calmodulin
MSGNKDLEKKVLEAFQAVDTAGTGFISIEALEKVLLSLNASITKDEINMIMSKLSTKDGQVAMAEFVRVFCGGSGGAPAGLRRELSKPVPAEQLEVIKTAFKQFDTDNSGSICVKELQAMCASLGKKLNDGQAKAAMAQLDKNGDDKVDFDEFLLWWTCTPGLGGYDHVALSYIKAKLALKSRAKTVFAKVSRKKVDDPNTFVWRGSIDLTPNYLNGRAGSDEKAAMTLRMKKLDAPRESDAPCMTMRILGKDPDAVAKALAQWEKIAEGMKKMNPDDEFFKMIKVTQDKNVLCFGFSIPKSEWDDGYDWREPKELLPRLEEFCQTIDVKLSLGCLMEDIVRDPMKPLPAHFRGAKVAGEVCIALEQLGATMAESAPPPVQKQIMAAVKLAAGFLQEAKIGFDETSAMMLVSRLKKKMASDLEDKYYKDPMEVMMTSCMDKGLQHARGKIYEAASKPNDEDGLGMIEKEKWKLDDAPDKEFAQLCIDFFALMNKDMAGMQSIIIDSIPECKLEFHILFDQFNPFCLGNYLFGHMPKKPVEDKSLIKDISSDETARLKEAFDKFDKDKSGAIDLKELAAVISSLGGSATEEEIEEAMVELDTNKDGNCCFEEFKTFWCSKSGLGGHNSTMLKFLKMKMQAGSFMSKGASALSRAGGHVSAASEGIFDTVVNFVQELSPGLAEIKDEKMSYTLQLEIEDVKKEEAPKYTMVYSCKNDADAASLKVDISNMMSQSSPMGPSVTEMLEMQGIGAAEIKAEGNRVIITQTAPEEMLNAMVYSQEDMMKVLVPSIKAVRNSGCKVSFMNSFQDFLEAPDMAIPTLFSGAKMSANLSAAAMGKEMMFKLMRSMGPKSKDAQDGISAAIECLKMFTGAEVTQAAGWHKAAITELLGLLPDGIEPTPAGLRALAAGMAPEGPPDEFKDYVKSYLSMIKKIEGVESMTLENIALPKEFSQNGKDATASLRTSFENVKPFGLIFYMAEPLLEAWGLSV